MIEPSGPLPTEVYWRRRLLAVAIAVVALAIVIGLIIWAGTGNSNDDAAAKNAAATSSTTNAPAPGEPVVPNPDGAPAPVEGDGGNPPAPADSPAPPPPADTPAPPTSPAEGQPAVACSDQALAVVLYTDKPTYTKGDQPVFTIVTTNAGLAPCLRDIGKASQNVVVRSLDGTRTLWSAQDCAPDKTVNEQILAPGQQVQDTVTWSGTSSNPGCTKPRTAIPVGAYQAIAKVGARESAPITFNVVAPAQR